MKLITRNTDYALRALCFMAGKKEIVSVDDLVKRLGVPRSFMRKILQQLNKENILESHKGQGGGFRLKACPKNIYLTQIMRIFQGQVGINGCFLKKQVCPNRGACVLRKKIHTIENNVIRELKKINIASLT